MQPEKKNKGRHLLHQNSKRQVGRRIHRPRQGVWVAVLLRSCSVSGGAGEAVRASLGEPDRQVMVALIGFLGVSLCASVWGLVSVEI